MMTNSEPFVEPPTIGGLCVFEKEGVVRHARIHSVTEKNIVLTTGEKVPRNRLWLSFTTPSLEALPSALEARRRHFSIDDIWQAAENREHSLTELTRRLTGNTDDALSQWAVIEQVVEHPAYFDRIGGRLQPVPPDLLEKRRLAQTVRRQQEQREREWAIKLRAGELLRLSPERVGALLCEPNKSDPLYRALKKYLGGDGVLFARYFIKTGLLDDARAYWRLRFEHDWPPPISTAPPPPLDDKFPDAKVTAFALDEAGTTEVDDAFSVTEAEGVHRIGVHIAAPGLIRADDIDEFARRRQTSVYFPDAKHCMLPDDVIDRYSLSENRAAPAVSIYFRYNSETGEWSTEETVVENIRLATRLTPSQAEQEEAPAAICSALAILKRFCAQKLPSEKPSLAGREFKISAHPPSSTRRTRTETTALIETLMRLVNLTWGRFISSSNVGGLYRVDGMTRTKAPDIPYMWLSSPLRRYVDLNNQRLLLSLLGHVPLPQPNWRELGRQYESQRALAREYQRILERHWALEALREGMRVVGDYQAKRQRLLLSDYPLSAKIIGTPPSEDIDNVTADIADIDRLGQRLQVTLT